MVANYQITQCKTIWIKYISIKFEMYVFMQKSNNYFIAFHEIFVSILYLSQIFLNVIAKVSSKEMFLI